MVNDHHSNSNRHFLTFRMASSLACASSTTRELFARVWLCNASNCVFSSLTLEIVSAATTCIPTNTQHTQPSGNTVSSGLPAQAATHQRDGCPPPSSGTPPGRLPLHAPRQLCRAGAAWWHFPSTAVVPTPTPHQATSQISHVRRHLVATLVVSMAVDTLLHVLFSLELVVLPLLHVHTPAKGLSLFILRACAPARCTFM